MPPAAAFPVGAAVEIASDDEGFRGSWFTGTVLRHISVSSSSGRGKGKRKAKAATTHAATTYLIEFDMLFEDEEGTKRLTEEVGEWQLRPVPPPEPKRTFKQGDEVDAFHNDGWWEGSITEELGNGKFEVYFRSTKESIQFKDDSLRIHREWISDDWIPPFHKQQNRLPAKEMTVAGGRSSRRLKKGELVRENGLPAKELMVAESVSTSKSRKRISVENGLPAKEVKVAESSTPKLRRRASVENGLPAKEVKVAESSTPKLRRRASVENGLPARELTVAESSSTPNLRKRASVENGLPVKEARIAVEQSSASIPKFRKGLLVEVSSDEEGFRGAWFSAKIDKEISKGKYRVQYQGLRNEDDTDFLYEEIDALYIRPTPPKRKTIGAYKVLEEVDALYNEGWWVGVICKVLENSRYVVFFRDTNEELEFSASDLRPHREWINGKWVTLSQL